ncbi:phosphoribosylanthranilate isomerase [Paenibacillus sp. 1011MAR3C5]|uniref:phosphoribosylanthranilate isomerase n=1 Tax=Paenibacillus sp. 1011MAR3C5 TaxID=1675787 RepID=UPI000E6C2EC8|nr:phosphoribosylanthranilate isomerase [Paenibacillus sp. 1011MAR3C5]RJE90051.1 phosphoribosylanthranilate isomerase [Paenibacillus sp. 1011MAR3C5]
MSVRVKICGLRDEATIQAMDGLSIDEIGLLFAPSKRQVSKEEASKLIEAIHGIRNDRKARPHAVGVFVNTSIEELANILAVAPLDVVQLHGQESPSYCAELRERFPGTAIWRVISIRPEAASASGGKMVDADERLAPYAGVVDAILIDAPGGGTGHPFNWDVIEAYKQSAGLLGLPLYVAGGLHVDNVQELLYKHSPDGVDVSSGVETDGRKDIEKIRSFVRRVREA